MNLLFYPNKALNTKANQVTVFDDNLVKEIEEMQKIREKKSGAGLAGPQVGINKRILVYTQSNGEESCMVNPEIIDSSGEQEFQEGCLSFPGVYIRVSRPKDISVKFQDAFGEFHTHDFTDYVSQCIQHEIDHLDGLLYVRFLSRLKQDLVSRKMTKALKKAEFKKLEIQKLTNRIQERLKSHDQV